MFLFVLYTIYIVLMQLTVLVFIEYGYTLALLSSTSH
jgi:hypothetical protein